MASNRANWILDDRLMRYVFAGAASVIAIGAITTRNEPAIDYSLLCPVVAAYWLWAVIEQFPRAPLYLLGVAVPLVLSIVESGEEVSMFIAVVTMAVAASYEPKRALAQFLLAVSVVLVLLLPAVGAIDSFSWQNWTFGLVFAWGAGTIVHRYTQALEELELTRSLVADQAALHERRRIARDVHDLVGHSLSVVMLHVTGARHLVRKDPDEAERALEQAEAAGRESLAEIRRTVGLLRDEADGRATALPSPDLSDVAALVDEFALAGLDVALHVDGPVDSVEGAPAVAGYRIAQEALTNASRHTVGARVVVTIRVDGNAVDVAVRNRGGATTEHSRGSGFGLISMRERAKSVGGSLVAGPIPSGWLVEASLPIVTAGAGERS